MIILGLEMKDWSPGRETNQKNKKQQQQSPIILIRGPAQFSQPPSFSVSSFSSSHNCVLDCDYQQSQEMILQ